MSLVWYVQFQQDRSKSPSIDHQKTYIDHLTIPELSARQKWGPLIVLLQDAQL
jgi:hypothetical protein